MKNQVRGEPSDIVPLGEESEPETSVYLPFILYSEISHAIKKEW